MDLCKADSASFLLKLDRGHKESGSEKLLHVALVVDDVLSCFSALMSWKELVAVVVGFGRLIRSPKSSGNLATFKTGVSPAITIRPAPRDVVV